VFGRTQIKRRDRPEGGSISILLALVVTLLIGIVANIALIPSSKIAAGVHERFKAKACFVFVSKLIEVHSASGQKYLGRGVFNLQPKRSYVRMPLVGEDNDTQFCADARAIPSSMIFAARESPSSPAIFLAELTDLSRINRRMSSEGNYLLRNARTEILYGDFRHQQISTIGLFDGFRNVGCSVDSHPRSLISVIGIGSCFIQPIVDGRVDNQNAQSDYTDDEIRLLKTVASFAVILLFVSFGLWLIHYADGDWLPYAGILFILAAFAVGIYSGRWWLRRDHATSLFAASSLSDAGEFSSDIRRTVGNRNAESHRSALALVRPLRQPRS
jgi:hypothetical protein